MVEFPQKVKGTRDFILVDEEIQVRGLQSSPNSIAAVIQLMHTATPSTWHFMESQKNENQCLGDTR